MAHLIKMGGAKHSFYEENGVQYLGKVVNEELLSDSEIETLSGILMKNPSEFIFDDNEGVPNYRSQLVCLNGEPEAILADRPNLSFLSKTHQSILDMVKETSNDSSWKMEDVSWKLSILYSPANSKVTQLPHRDLEIVEDTEKTFLIFGALQDNTFLHVYLRSHLKLDENQKKDKRRKNFPRKLLLNRGEVLKFHPALIHAGSSYLQANVRLHYYILPNGQIVGDYTNVPTPEDADMLADTNCIERRRKQVAGIRTASARKKSKLNARLQNIKLGRKVQQQKRNQEDSKLETVA